MLGYRDFAIGGVADGCRSREKGGLVSYSLERSGIDGCVGVGE
jgi:hypothetical protein